MSRQNAYCEQDVSRTASIADARRHSVEYTANHLHTIRTYHDNMHPAAFMYDD